ncbi:uncharacterized protein STEHIDRAFT_55231 [Stereum hirsutum FP-91666 SS1]|uniref:uncharacterized protein n=1 Tax=Stereum hirsutum (strain FP-91666) TaxID=721885 RepID=UPI000440D045|nr:uncharacterized protein STEHIDRAFT_55231 [Stereum hirsutum FP-91666 SS1]EIM88052.1 hypothetical protein STEHIDRAFT_55231 [Stereum hirsutum FP-91666 SS1]
MSNYLRVGTFNNPPLSIEKAHILNVAFTLAYVVPLYLTKYTMPAYSSKEPNWRWRDDPKVIRARMASVTLSTLAVCSYVYLIFRSNEAPDSAWTWTYPRLGFIWHPSLIWPCLITPALYLGPLYAQYLSKELPLMAHWSYREHIADTFFHWRGCRNFLVGPLSEELAWRSCVICVYHLAGASTNFLIFFTPLSFGAAHLHHAWEVYNQFGRTSQALKNAILSTVFQFTYTTLFGFHCAFLFVRSGSVIPPLLAHIFCNVMGVPQLQAELKRHVHHRTRTSLMSMVLVLLFRSLMFDVACFQQI